VQRCVQRQLSTFYQGHDPDGGEALGNRGGPEWGSGGGWNSIGNVGETIAFFKNDLAVLDQNHRSAGHRPCFEQRGQLAIQALDAARRCCLLRRRMSAGAQQQRADQHAESQPSARWRSVPLASLSHEIRSLYGGVGAV
jgi:hypothetical protein